MTNNEKKESMPQEAGFYWVKSAGYDWFNGIVQVYGDAPFFKVLGYNFNEEKEIDDIAQIHAFGKKIDEEEQCGR